MEINSERRDTIKSLNSKSLNSKLLDSKPLDSLLEFAAQPSAVDFGAVVEQAITLLEQAYVSLPDKRLQGIDPVERLKQLRLKLPSSMTEFYREMLLIFGALGDRHTYCHLPEPFARQIAFDLPPNTSYEKAKDIARFLNCAIARFSKTGAVFKARGRFRAPSESGSYTRSPRSRDQRGGFSTASAGGTLARGEV